MTDSKAKREWAKENMLLLGLKLHKTKDADIISWLDRIAEQGKQSKQAYIKQLIRNAITEQMQTS